MPIIIRNSEVRIVSPDNVRPQDALISNGDTINDHITLAIRSILRRPTGAIPIANEIREDMDEIPSTDSASIPDPIWEQTNGIMGALTEAYVSANRTIANRLARRASINNGRVTPSPFGTSTRSTPTSRRPDLNLTEQACIACGASMSELAQAIYFNFVPDRGLYCDHCYFDRSFDCFNCKEHTVGDLSVRHYLEGTMIDIRRPNDPRQKEVCPKCKDLFKICFNCKLGFKPSDAKFANGVNDFCLKCTKSILARSAPPIRPFQDVSFPVQAGECIASLRRFGIELEARYHECIEAGMAYLMLPHEVGSGTDGSINGAGVEVRTAPVAGRYAEKLIDQTCFALRANKFTVDSSCGYHIHVDVGEIDSWDQVLTAARVRELWLFYTAFEDVILSFLHPSRRTNVRYCAPMKTEFNLKEIMEARNMDELEKLWYRKDTIKKLSQSDVARSKGEHRNFTRYRGINFHPLFSDRHLEIRYHSGTLNPTKIKEWANLHTRIVDTVFRTGVSNDWIRRVANEPDIFTKASILFSYVGLTLKSEAYFSARQAEFWVSPPALKGEAYKESVKLLKEEKES